MTGLKSPFLDPPNSFLLACDAETGVARITLNRPERLNALTFEVYDELRSTFRALDSEPEVRAIVITGAGRGFCTGGDVEDIIGALFERDFEGLLEFTRMTCDLIAAIRQCRQPVVGALNGTVAGRGRDHCDGVRRAHRGGVGAYRVSLHASGPVRRGHGRGVAAAADRGAGARDRTADDRERSSTLSEAHRIGLYNRVVPDGEVVGAATTLAEELARGPSFALQVTREALNREAHMELEEALEAEARAQAECMLNPNFREAYEAFIEKRRPRFV